MSLSSQHCLRLGHLCSKNVQFKSQQKVDIHFHANGNASRRVLFTAVNCFSFSSQIGWHDLFTRFFCFPAIFLSLHFYFFILMKLKKLVCTIAEHQNASQGEKSRKGILMGSDPNNLRGRIESWNLHKSREFQNHGRQGGERISQSSVAPSIFFIFEKIRLETVGNIPNIN
jgi:hypothetical protein